ncbi:hypothetical protein FACS1894204_13350 [Synergistales bacterium]|nr:hypothetical protein FACS1894204_13350 [Synergistales bacterium]
MNSVGFGFLQAAQIAEIFSIHKNTWFKWVSRGLIGKGIKLGYRRVGWPIEDIRELYERIKSGEIVVREEQGEGEE